MAMVATLLGIVTLAVYWPARHFGFIELDDNLYVFDNPHVLSGISWANIKWAFITGHASNWHPLTWLAHMLAAELFGLRPGWHHLVNVLIHAANTILLFFLLRRVAGYGAVRESGFPSSKAPIWRCAFVAALFALHPLHVESVAWISELKDVLSTLFFLLTLGAYLRYAEQQRPGCMLQVAGSRLPEQKNLQPSAFNLQPRSYYFLALLLFALGLLSKPMLVTTPFVLLLLDFWPLGRLAVAGPKPEIQNPKSEPDTAAASLDPRTTDHGLPAVSSAAGSAKAEGSAKAGPQTKVFSLQPSAFSLFWEKVPFLLLAALSCLMTMEAQYEGHAVTLGLPFGLRLANAVVSYLKYLGKMVWPAGLAALYPHPNSGFFLSQPGAAHPLSEQWPQWQIMASAAVLVLISALAWIRHRRQPWFLFGWLWFLGTLVPVLGLVQVGLQGFADRYTYIPLIGIFMNGAWGAAEILGSSETGRRVGALAGVSMIAACVVLSHRQLGYWQSNFAVFSRALEVTRNNALAECIIGDEYGEYGKYGIALAYFRSSLRSNPNFASAHFGLARTYVLMGKLQEGVEEYKAGLRLAPWSDRNHNAYGKLLWDLGKREEALTHYLAAIQLNPDFAAPHYNAGVAFAEMEDYEVAAGQLARAAQLQPNNPDAFSHLGEVLLKLGKTAEARRANTEAEKQFEALVRRHPADPEARINLGGVLCRLGRLDDAETSYREAIRLQPGNPVFFYDLGLALADQEKFADAVEQFGQAVKLKPDYTEALNQQGRSLAAQSKFAEAVASFRQLARLMPTNVTAELNLGNALMMAGQTNDATACFSNAVRLDPALVEKNVQAGRTCAANRDARGALARFRTALWLKPDDPALLNDLAWLLATSADTAVRDGAEAARVAQRACDLNGGKDPRYLSTLDIAYAQAGRFPEAIRAAEKTREVAAAAGQTELARAAESRLDLYRKQLPATK
jgi:tetratricopeptide (TPR) repeat protein